MIHEPEVEVTCDGEKCINESHVFLPMDWGVGGYDLEEKKAENLLINDHGWTVKEGKHYCRHCDPEES